MQMTQGWLWLHIWFVYQRCPYKPFLLPATVSDDYAQRVRVLLKYYVQNIHNWDQSGSCNFYPARICSCKKCGEHQIKCTGEPYKTKTPLKCDFHWLAYRIECERIADEAESVIHPEMGPGHWNICEASLTVLPQFRLKSQSFCRYYIRCQNNHGFSLRVTLVSL